MREHGWCEIGSRECVRMRQVRLLECGVLTRITTERVLRSVLVSTILHRMSHPLVVEHHLWRCRWLTVRISTSRWLW